MTNRALGGVITAFALLLAVTVWLALRVATLEGRLAGLEPRVASLEAAPRMGLGMGAARGWPTPPAGARTPRAGGPAFPAIEGVPGDPGSQAIARPTGESAEQVRERMVGIVRDEVEAFAEQEGIDDATVDEIVRVYEDIYGLGAVLREDVATGQTTVPEAREEMITAREEADAYLIELLGEERYDRLMSRFPGQHGAPPK